jgi:inosine-uridine nucleoside N-ribohydrolase
VVRILVSLTVARALTAPSGLTGQEPVKGSALDIPAEPLTGCQYLLARFARLGPLCELQRVQNPRFEPHSGPIPVWIDTDPALGEPERDVDDGFALIQAFRSPELAIRGVSVVFGNAPLHRGLPIAQRLVREHGPAGLPVYSGAAGADALGIETAASRALGDALRREPLTILVLGPATNVATALKDDPKLASRIIRVVAVAGRRPGQRFTTGTSNPKGHRDFNFESDPESFRVLLTARVPLVLAPFEISSKIWITRNDLDRLAAGPPSSQALAGPAREWLMLWQRLFGVDGFNPFDTLAVAYVVSSAGFECETLPVQIQALPDDVTEPGVQGTRVDTKPYLLISRTFDAPARAHYCSSAPDNFKSDLLDRLMR